MISNFPIYLWRIFALHQGISLKPVNARLKDLIYNYICTKELK